jgi:hypothetical protein
MGERSDGSKVAVRRPEGSPRDAGFSDISEHRSKFARVRAICDRAWTRSPKANSLCERLIGTLRRECLDWVYPIVRGASSKNPLVVVTALQPRPTTLLLWARHPRSDIKFPRASAAPSASFRRPSRIVAHAVLDGLHHEYTFFAQAA